ncbi:hypothetical protein CF54_14005 [Streptomyces sp. Tu 6176]|nr:hypothetical protein CF54_14005 [Streptomyces sp. Tu 6176]
MVAKYWLRAAPTAAPTTAFIGWSAGSPVAAARAGPVMRTASVIWLLPCALRAGLASYIAVSSVTSSGSRASASPSSQVSTTSRNPASGRSLKTVVSRAAISSGTDRAMSCLEGKYRETVRGATSAASAMSAMVVPS